MAIIELLPEDIHNPPPPRHPADGQDEDRGLPIVPPGISRETHVFSTREWRQANPGGDPAEARQAAAQLGYEVVD